MSLAAGLRSLPRDVWVLFGTALVNRMGTMAIPFLVLYLMKDLGFGPGRAGAILALFGVVSLLTSPVSGFLVDRVGSLRVMRASLFLSSVFLGLYPLVRSFFAIVAMTILWAFTTELYRPASLAAISELVPAEHRKTAFAVNRLAINLGMSIGPAVGGFLATRSFPLIFVIDGVTSILAGLVLILFWRGAFVPRSASERAARTSGAASRDPRLVFFLVALVPVGVVFFQHESAMAVQIVDILGLPASRYGLLFTLNTLLIVACEVPLNGAMAGWRHAHQLALGSVLIGAGFAVLGVATTGVGAAVSTVVWTVGEMILLPALSAYVADLAPAERRGEYMGLYVMAFNLAFAVGPWAGLQVLSRFGSGVLWGSCLVLGAVSAALFWTVRDPVARDPS